MISLNYISLKVKLKNPGTINRRACTSISRSNVGEPATRKYDIDDLKAAFNDGRTAFAGKSIKDLLRYIFLFLVDLVQLYTIQDIKVLTFRPPTHTFLNFNILLQITTSLNLIQMTSVFVLTKNAILLQGQKEKQGEKSYNR